MLFRTEPGWIHLKQFYAPQRLLRFFVGKTMFHALAIVAGSSWLYSSLVALYRWWYGVFFLTSWSAHRRVLSSFIFQ